MKRLRYYWQFFRGFVAIRFCPRRWRPGVLAVAAAYMDFDGYAGPSALLECTAKELLPEDVGEIAVVVRCKNGCCFGTARITNR